MSTYTHSIIVTQGDETFFTSEDAATSHPGRGFVVELAVPLVGNYTVVLQPAGLVVAVTDTLAQAQAEADRRNNKPVDGTLYIVVNSPTQPQEMSTSS